MLGESVYFVQYEEDAALAQPYTSKHFLTFLTHESLDERIASNPEYITSELIKERDEGTATYVSIKASRLVGYDYGVMYFDNVKDVPFCDVFSQINAGNLEYLFPV